MRELHAVLVAGGLASRMGRLAEVRPKALLPFGNTTLLSHHLQALRSHGVTHATIIAGHLAEVIKSELSAVVPSGIPIDLIAEPTAAGSGGCLRYLPRSQGPLLVVFADIMSWMDYTALVELHRRKAAQITAVVHPNDHPRDSDMVETNAEGWVMAIRRKPRPATALCRNLALAGVFVVEPDILGRIPPAGAHDLVHDLVTSVVNTRGRVLHVRV